MKKSGAKVSLTHEVDSNGMCTVRITGSEGAVSEASDLVVAASLQQHSKLFDPSEYCSILINLTVDESSSPTKKPAVPSRDCAQANMHAGEAIIRLIGGTYQMHEKRDHRIANLRIGRAIEGGGEHDKDGSADEKAL